jgi:hypothetical protein
MKGSDEVKKSEAKENGADKLLEKGTDAKVDEAKEEEKDGDAKEAPKADA